MAIIWTKNWTGADDGTILKAIDIKNIQDDLANVQTVGDTLSIPGQVQGDTLYFNGSDWTRLPAGTSGQLLKTNGPAANPSWVTASTTATDLNIPSQANGTILYFNGTNWVVLPAGTSGQLLQSNGVAAPSWVTVPVGVLADYTVGNDFEGGPTRFRSVATPTSTSYEKIGEIYMTRGGTIRVKFGMEIGIVEIIYGRVYRNGSAVGTEQTLNNTNWTYFTEDIAGWTAGDLLQLYTHSTTGTGFDAGDMTFSVGNPTLPHQRLNLPYVTHFGDSTPNVDMGIQGDFYIRTDGGVGSTLYVKSAVTTWTPT